MVWLKWSVPRGSSAHVETFGRAFSADLTDCSSVSEDGRTQVLYIGDEDDFELKRSDGLQSMKIQRCQEAKTAW